MDPKRAEQTEQTEEYKRLYALLAGLSSKGTGAITPMISLGDLLGSTASSRRSTPKRKVVHVAKNTPEILTTAFKLDPGKHSEHETGFQELPRPRTLDASPLSILKTDLDAKPDGNAPAQGGVKNTEEILTTAFKLDPEKHSEHETGFQELPRPSTLDASPLSILKTDLDPKPDGNAPAQGGKVGVKNPMEILTTAFKLDPGKHSEHETGFQELPRPSTSTSTSAPLSILNADAKPDANASTPPPKAPKRPAKKPVDHGTSCEDCVKVRILVVGEDVKVTIDPLKKPAKAKEDLKAAKPKGDLKAVKPKGDLKPAKPKGAEGPLDVLFAPTPTDTLTTLTQALEARCRQLVVETAADLSRALVAGRGHLTLSGATLRSLMEDTLQGATQTWDGRCRYCEEAGGEGHYAPSTPCYVAALSEFKRRVAAL
jgi:hypothetical protein